MNDYAPLQFGLSTMLVTTTIVAVLMSICVMLPPLGIALFVLSVPAAIRSYVLVLRYRMAGYPIAATQQALLFFSCLSIAWLILVASAFAFALAFVAATIVFQPVGLSAGMIGGTIGGLTVLAMLMRRWFKTPATKPGESTNWLFCLREDRRSEGEP